MLREALDAEIAARIEGDEALDDKIEAETARATERENEIEEALLEEIARATERENEIEGGQIDPSKNPYIMSVVNVNGFNLVLETKDGVEENFIKIKLDGSFGTI